MKLSALGEFGLIRAIRQRAPRSSPRTVIGIGDDAAALKVSPSALLLATTDMLVEGVHFDLSYTDFYSLGWKSAAVNVSDIAAMGGTPRFCLTSLAVPSQIPAEKILEFYRGCGTVLKRFVTALVGGDTCAADGGMVVSVTVLGEVAKKNAITRAGARPGDRIFITNTLGDSAAGLELLKHGVKGPGARGRDAAQLIERHLRPVPRIGEGLKIARTGCASAMIDVSDGLSSDLGHICEASGVGAVIHADRVPLSGSLRNLASRLRNELITYALSGGEDYELLLTVRPDMVGKLCALGVPLTEIGEITRSRKITLVDERGRQRRLPRTGYDHFAASAVVGGQRLP